MRRNLVNKIVPAVMVGLILAGIQAFAQSGVEAAQDYLRIANQAYRDGNFNEYAASLEKALELNPHSILTRYNLACGYARSGRNAEAIDILHQLVDMKIDFGVEHDEDLASLHEEPDFVTLVGSLQEELEPISNSRHRFTIEQLGLIPEGIAIDSVTNRLFIGSMRSGDIYVIDNEDRLSKFAAVQHEGKLAAIGLEVDAARGMLWAVGAAFDTVEGFDADAPPRTGVFGFDLESGNLLRKYIGDETFTGFNDLTVSRSGDIYLSGGQMGVVRNGGDVIEHFDASMPIYGSNGITLETNGGRLFVSSYPVGVAVVDLQTGASNWLQAPANTTLYGIDGLYWYEGNLIGVQNGVRPWRLIRMELDESRSFVTSTEFIEFANQEVTPTTGAIAGNVIHYVGEGPQPDPVPGHFPPALAQYAGKTIVMTAPLN